MHNFTNWPQSHPLRNCKALVEIPKISLRVCYYFRVPHLDLAWPLWPYVPSQWENGLHIWRETCSALLWSMDWRILRGFRSMGIDKVNLKLGTSFESHYHWPTQELIIKQVKAIIDWYIVNKVVTVTVMVVVLMYIMKWNSIGGVSNFQFQLWMTQGVFLFY